MPREEKRPTRARDAGVTFVETVLTVVLLGVVVVPILAAVRGAITTSSTAEAAAQVETVLINAADRVQRAPNSGSDGCDFSAHARAAAASAGWSPQQVQVRHEYLAGQHWAIGQGTSPACPESGNAIGLAKRVTISVTSPDGKITRSIQVVKSDV